MKIRILNVIRLLLFSGALFYGCVIVFMFLYQSRLIYFPSRTIYATPAAAGLEYDRVSFSAPDGISLAGWFVPCDGSRKTILICHGNGGNISDRIESIDIFHRMGLNVFIFDYRGYGESSGKPSEGGTYSDTVSAWDYLVKFRKIKPDDIIIFGRSLGAALAAYTACHYKPGALILESAFTSINDIGSQSYPFVPVRLLSRFGYSTIRYIEDVTCPVIIIHSRDDEMIPLSHGEALFAAARQPKMFLEIEGSHNNGFISSGVKYASGIEAFISKHLN